MRNVPQNQPLFHFRPQLPLQAESIPCQRYSDSTHMADPQYGFPYPSPCPRPPHHPMDFWSSGKPKTQKSVSFHIPTKAPLSPPYTSPPFSVHSGGMMFRGPQYNPNCPPQSVKNVLPPESTPPYQVINPPNLLPKELDSPPAPLVNSLRSLLLAAQQSTNTSEYSPDLVDAMFACEDITFSEDENDELTENAIPSGRTIHCTLSEKFSHHSSIAMGGSISEQTPMHALDVVSPTAAPTDSVCPIKVQAKPTVAVKQQMAFLAIPVELLQQCQGLTKEQVVQGIEDMRIIASQLSPPDTTHSEDCGDSVSCASTGPEETDGSRFPTVEGGRCSHRKCWKRLRAKRRYTYFICLECGVKWRSTGQSERARQQAVLPGNLPYDSSAADEEELLE